mmetsp:Transcript_2614/g.6225  ORF Transcript_2614/g.6225 Transcript_2614/m.6225 type:complete len:121 (-) Transcript_2614:264-626(-)
MRVLQVLRDLSRRIAGTSRSGEGGSEATLRKLRERNDKLSEDIEKLRKSNAAMLKSREELILKAMKGTVQNLNESEAQMNEAMQEAQRVLEDAGRKGHEKLADSARERFTETLKRTFSEK